MQGKYNVWAKNDKFFEIPTLLSYERGYPVK